MKVKQVIIIRKDLNMRRGKEIAQGAHASMAVLCQVLHDHLYEINIGHRHEIELDEELNLWLNGDFTKVVLQVDSLEQILELGLAARANNLTVHTIEDKGFTEFKEPTITAMAIGPHYEDKIDPITKYLKLY